MTNEQVLEFVGVIASAGLAGVGGAMAWFRAQRKDLLDRMDDFMAKTTDAVADLRASLRCQEDEYHENDKSVAELRADVRNHVKRLDDIVDTTKDTNHKLDKMTEAMTSMAISLSNIHRGRS